MKPENLETLLLDRALGQLAPEVEDLLATHVARDPAASRRAEVLTSTVSLARRATAMQAAPQPRAARSDDAQWRRVRRSLRWRAAGRDGLKLTAGLALGLALAWLVRPALPGRTELLAAAEPRSVAPAESPAAARAAPAFWSASRLVAGAQRAAERPSQNSNRYEPRWFSPAKPQKAEEKL